MRRDIAAWLMSSLEGRDLLFVTLTCSRRVERSELSSAILKLTHRIKRRVLGRKTEHVELAQVVVLEPTFKGGVHAHVILEDPYSLASAKAFPCTMPIWQVITEEWTKMGLGGKGVAQDVQRVYDLLGAIKYLLKTIGRAPAFDRMDINSSCLPNRSAHTPIPNSHVPLARDNQ